MSDPNSTSPDILSDGPVKDILRPGHGLFENTSIMMRSKPPYKITIPDTWRQEVF
jgi:hypothetical protein